ncbi:hypothetical protein GCM10023065_32020 [Microbacterium laevaniformans]|jgi:hypothetical protein|uniref:hypothetical protein n=2 Tax=Microbacterium laevaniformans TaxID=36807 RepID=UPI0002587BE2|nr:hypothetical protein [Microbacterium laevaniformans]EIC06425.1 integral membrane protein [Microbacterium laevaniformans OR221]MBM7751291.1 hypothetical protein [Microbacterium laevaniformans]GLJ63454.1 hypothetical protein GCM10017578_03410 [Microbacterium laevaniformans]
MNRTLAVARMQLVNKQTFVWVPLIITAVAFVISWLIAAIITNAIGAAPAMGSSFNGAGQAPLWYFLAIGIQSLTLTFPFSQAMSVSRRTFFVGTTAIAAGAGAVLATVYSLLRIPEASTNGWGVGSYMFNLPGITDATWYEGWVFFFAVTVSFFLLGFWIATIYKRFGPTMVTTVLSAIGLVLIGAVALITWQRWWGDVGAWLATQTPLTFGLWLLVLCVVLAGSSYLTLRRATP